MGRFSTAPVGSGGRVRGGPAGSPSPARRWWLVPGYARLDPRVPDPSSPATSRRCSRRARSSTWSSSSRRNVWRPLPSSGHSSSTWSRPAHWSPSSQLTMSSKHSCADAKPSGPPPRRPGCSPAPPGAQRGDLRVGPLLQRALASWKRTNGAATSATSVGGHQGHRQRQSRPPRAPFPAPTVERLRHTPGVVTAGESWTLPSELPARTIERADPLRPSTGRTVVAIDPTTLQAVDAKIGARRSLDAF